MPNKLWVQLSVAAVLGDPFTDGRGDSDGLVTKQFGIMQNVIGQEPIRFERIIIALQRAAQADRVPDDQIRQLFSAVGVFNPSSSKIAAAIDDLAPECPPFPVAGIGGVHPKHDKKTKQ